MNSTVMRRRGSGAFRAASLLVFGAVLCPVGVAQDVPNKKPETGKPAAGVVEATVGKTQAKKPDKADAARAGTATTGTATTGKATTVATGKARPPKLAKIISEGSAVRCFASNLSPVYEDRLAKGTVVSVGAAVGEYRRVLLPLGVIGYVSTRFASAPVKGLCHTTRPSVSFRYRPTTPNRIEAPVLSLDEGTALRCLGRRGDWWRVRLVTESAYLPIKEIQVFETPNETLQKSYQQLLRTHRGEWRDATAAHEKKLAEAVLRKKQMDQLEALRLAFEQEKNKKLAEQNLSPVRDGLQKIIAALPKDAPLLAAAEYLGKAIAGQQVLIDAEVLLNPREPAPTPPKVKIAKTPADRLGSLHAIGWLSYRPRDPGPTRYRLEKGGRVVSYLYCNNLRYDLPLFAGVEIGVQGIRREDGGITYLDVQRIEVLGHAR